MPKQTQLTALRNKVLELGQRYHSSGRYLPIAFIAEFLEKVSCHLGLTGEAWIVDALVKIDIPLIDVLDTYDQVNLAIRNVLLISLFADLPTSRRILVNNWTPTPSSPHATSHIQSLH